MCSALLAAPAALGLAGAPAHAQDQTSAGSNAQVVVTARRLNAARASIQPQVGASTYAITQAQIEALPAGQNTALNQVVLQAPGVAQDSYSQLHIRGEHNGLQYRLDGIILPEGLSVFSQALSPRLADQVELITGALPAEYGLRTAGIIDITTKSGALNNGGSVSIYGGSHGEIEPSFEYGGTYGNFNLFVSGSYLASDLGIESPDGRSNPLHDHTQQAQGFAYLEDILDPQSSLSVILGTSDDRFQIPDVSGGLNGGFGFNVNGQTDRPSQDLNENQAEDSQYGVVSYLHTTDRLTTQVSLFARYSTLKFTPDPVGDLLYNGIAQVADKTDTAGGVQAEGAYHLNDQHTLRGGVIVEVDRSTSDTTSQVLLIDNNPASPTFGQQISNAPFAIVDNGSRTAETYSAYLQDEWKLLEQPHAQLRDSLRPVRRLPKREPGQPAGQFGLVADPDDDHPRRLRSLLLAAAVRANRERVGAEGGRAHPRQPEHHVLGGPSGHDRHDAVRRAGQLFRRGRGAEGRAGPDADHRQLLQALKAPDR